MPRIKSSPRKCVKSRNGQAKTWVLMMENNTLGEDGKGTTDMVKLRHPRTNQTAMFIFSADNTTVQEVFSFCEKKRSWFIDDSVKEDGQMHLSTPVDPAFLILPYLKRSKEEGMVVPLPDLLMDGAYPETSRLLDCAGNIHLLADRKGNEELNAWMYNEEKTLKWLCKKTERVATALREKNLHVGGAATSHNFVKSSKSDENSEQDKDSYLRYAHGLVSEYLADDLNAKLLTSLNLPAEENKREDASVAAKRKSSQEKGENKRSKGEGEEGASVLDLSQPLTSPPSTNRPLSSKEKARLKAASGSKAITSFFKKK